MSGDYWFSKVGTREPSEAQVLDLLVHREPVLIPDDDEEPRMDTFDITLPDDVTQYVLCVRFDGNGTISVTMES